MILPAAAAATFRAVYTKASESEHLKRSFSSPLKTLAVAAAAATFGVEHATASESEASRERSTHDPPQPAAPTRKLRLAAG